MTEPKAEDRGQLNRVKVEFEGQELPADDLTFDTEQETWGSYRVEDGTQIKVKHVVARVARLVDRYKEDGSPMYVIYGTVIISALSPDELKRKPEAS